MAVVSAGAGALAAVNTGGSTGSAASAGAARITPRTGTPQAERSSASSSPGEPGIMPPLPPTPPEPQAGSTKAKKTGKKAKKPAYRVVKSGSCQASYYWEGQMTASGERFDPDALTAAHRTLPMGSKVRVINKKNGRSVIVRINDRGPFIAGRCLDLSRAAMRKVGGTGSGVIPVRYEVLKRV
ncbi:septal ring lytic transglycosylase RlpA family protein [Actinomadura sp. NBRC 104412]|uniref:septal ring lytic transglycosylase RlpA family protein n=1 Tax=Actinomadura sp. NBRC 104412 TaxID=3032203 RepID=UPI0025539C6B|nr:septal ring lytic transglycosylase RlpA family protein [Actinomadura sp. NBRC 104412]